MPKLGKKGKNKKKLKANPLTTVQRSLAAPHIICRAFFCRIYIHPVRGGGVIRKVCVEHKLLKLPSNHMQTCLVYSGPNNNKQKTKRKLFIDKRKEEEKSE